MSSDHYTQLDRPTKPAKSNYCASFLMLRQEPTRHYKGDGNPYDACLYKTMVCELVQLDDPWHEFGEDWQHYYWSDETEVVKVVMRAGEATEGLGWFTIEVRYVNNPLNVRGHITERIEQ